MSEMRKELVRFDFDGCGLRVQFDEIGQPWFNANDVCAALEFVNPHKAVADHVDADDLTKREATDALGRRQCANFISESGLYALILGSTKEAAKRFKRWVTGEVLPAIRKTGRYEVAQQLQALPDFSDPVAAARAWADQLEARQKAEKAIALAAPKVETLERITGNSLSRSLRDASRVLKVPEKQFISTLLERGWLLRGPEYMDRSGNPCQGRLVAAAEARTRGYLEMNVVEAGGKARDAVRVTPLGVERLGVMLPKWVRLFPAGSA